MKTYSHSVVTVPRNRQRNMYMVYICCHCNIMYKYGYSNGLCCGKKMKVEYLTRSEYDEIRTWFNRSVKLSALTAEQLIKLSNLTFVEAKLDICE